MTIVRPLQPEDRSEWLRLRTLLWPDADRDELESETREYINNTKETCVLVALRAGGGLCGMVELSLRDVAEGCSSSPVGYVEGWYVDADVRRTRVGAALVAAGEEWARQRGCTEMGSDTELENALSQKAHVALGYRVTERLVTFLKRL